MVALVTFALVGCAIEGPGAEVDGIDDAFAQAGKADGAAGLDAAETAGVLAVANTLSQDALDHDVALDRRAATGIVERREQGGAFTTLAQLDAVPWVGPVALDRLLAYAWANDFVVEGEPSTACLMISEYAEGQGNNNKAVEVWNCGQAPVQLGEHSLCLVRNDDASCTVTAAFTEVELAANATWVVCRTHGGTFNDPMQSLRDRCDQAMPGVMVPSGDDRFAILDGDGTVLDAFGRLSWRPATSIWADVVLRRCALQPYLGAAFFTTAEQYTAHGRHDHTDLGVAPQAGCS